MLEFYTVKDRSSGFDASGFKAPKDPDARANFGYPEVVRASSGANGDYPEVVHASDAANGHMPERLKWPMMTAEQRREYEAALTNLDADWALLNAETIEIGPTLLDEDTQVWPETEKRINFSLAHLAMNGIYRAGQIIRGANHLAAVPINTLDNVTRFISVQALNRLPSFEKKATAASVEDISENQPEIKKNHKKMIYGAVGTAALAGVGFYLASRGFSHNINVSHIHEVTQNAPVPKHNPAAEVASNMPSPSKSHPETQRIVHRIYLNRLNKSINIGPGDGYTQAIAKLFPNHDSTAYLSVYKEAIRQFGPNFIKGIHHYRMANGNWGFSGSGKAELTKPALHLLSNFFKSHQ